MTEDRSEHSTPSHEEEGELSEKERVVLASWKVDGPRAGFAKQVLSAMDGERTAGRDTAKKRPPLRPVLALAASLLLALAAGIGAFDQRAEGALLATQRVTFSIGRRATLVAEAGSEIRFSVDFFGAAEVEQKKGDVFYRVERGGPFVVRTSAGEVRVKGTCFRMEVESVSNRTQLKGMAGGALAATVLVVSVYEGRVVTASPAGEISVNAGETAAIEAGRAPVLQAARPGKAPPSFLPGDPDRPGEDRAQNGKMGELQADLPPSVLRAETARLSARVAELEKALEGQEKQNKKQKTYDLDPEELQTMAERCELRWDMPAMSSTPSTLSPADTKELGLTEEEKKAVNQRFRQHSEDTREQLRRLYTEVTGDPNTESLSADALWSEIEDKSTKDEVKRTFQKLSAERAGLLSAPGSIDPTSPAVERMFRLFTGAGDRFEASVAEVIGADRAHALRDLHGGFGSKSRATNGCPNDTALPEPR